jgi:hypothetical protein
MSSPVSTIASVTRAWRYGCLVLGALLLASWGYLGAAVLQRDVALSKCRVQHEELWRDVIVLGEAARGRVSKEVLLTAQAELEPKPAPVIRGAVVLRAVQVEFGEDGLLWAIADR